MSESSVIERINNSSSVVIAGHTNPDGDSVGASFALAMALNKMGKNVWVILEEYHTRFHIIPGREHLYTGDPNALTPDTFIAVDCGSADRLGSAEVFLKKAAHTINIDHHINNTCFAEINYLDTASASASEIVFHIINKLILIDKDVASALYAGIVFDTGGFRHNSTSLDTLTIVSQLISLGIPFSTIYNELMHFHTLAEAKIMGRALARLTLYENGRIAAIVLTAEDFAAAGATAADLNGVCEYALNTAGVEIAALVYLKGTGCKISLRSKAVFVNGLAEQLGGGGHELAAGCDFKGTPEQALDTILTMLKAVL